MCDVLSCNSTEHGIWLNDESQGQYHGFFKDKLLILEERNGWIYYLNLCMNCFGKYILVQQVWHHKKILILLHYMTYLK